MQHTFDSDSDFGDGCYGGNCSYDNHYFYVNSAWKFGLRKFAQLHNFEQFLGKCMPLVGEYTVD